MVFKGFQRNPIIRLKKVFPLTVQNLLNPKQEKEQIFKKKVSDKGRIYSKEGLVTTTGENFLPPVETFPLPQLKVMRWGILIFNKA